MTSIQLNISEIFYSLQGEGPFAGRPAIFIRFSGCNLRCKWGDSFCDTPYASWEAETRWMSLAEIVQTLHTLAPQCFTIILTGGEPTLQNHFDEFCQDLARRGYQLHLETNGLGPIPDAVDWIICSPKLADSTPRGTAHEQQHETLRTALDASVLAGPPRLFLKFVITAESNWAEVEQLIARLRVPPERIYLMPEGCGPREISQHAPYVANKALEHGYQFSHRLHILLWGGERGT